MSLPDKNCYRSQGGGVVDINNCLLNTDQANINKLYCAQPHLVEAAPPLNKSKIKTAVQRNEYFYD